MEKNPTIIVNFFKNFGSFVKGWGEGYKIENITSAPCWVEINLLYGLQHLDGQCSEIVTSYFEKAKFRVKNIFWTLKDILNGWMVLMVTSLRRIRKNLPTKIFEIMTHNSSLILFMSYQTVFNQSREMVALSSLKLLL